MQTKKIRWLIYTVLVGLIPIVSRCFVWMVTNAGTVDPLAAADFVAFGLVLHTATINELDRLSTDNSSWKVVHTGLAVSCVAFYSVLYSIGLVGDKIVDQRALTFCATLMALFSFLLNYSVFVQLDKAPQEEC
jgi:hypothetical protein